MFVIAALLGAVVPAAVVAQEEAAPAPASTLQLVAPYPAVAVQAGETASFAVNVLGPGRQLVDLGLSDVPDGWTATIRGGGAVVEAVMTDPDTPANVTIDVTVAPDATEGTEELTLTGTTDGGTATLPLRVTVSEQAAGAVALTTDFPALQGAADQTFPFDATLRNDGAEEATFALSAEGPPGWLITATPATEEQATTATVGAGETASIRVTADPPDDTEAGTYDLTVRATGGGSSAELPLVVEIVGSPSLVFTTPDERLNAEVTLGRTTDLALLVINDGSAPLQQVTFSATPPPGWEVTFEPEAIQTVQPGETAQVTAVIEPSADTVAGDYLLTLSAQGGGGSVSESVEIRTAVGRPPTAGIIGILLIAAALLALAATFRRFGRR